MSKQSQNHSSQQSGELIKDSSHQNSSQIKQIKQVIKSYDEGQLEDNSDELGEVFLQPTASVQVKKSVQNSIQLPQLNIIANKSAHDPRGHRHRQQEKIKYKKPYSEPRSQQDMDMDHFSDRSLSETRSQVRNRNIFVSVGVGALAAIAGFYVSKQDKRVAGVAAALGFIGTYLLITRD